MLSEDCAPSVFVGIGTPSAHPEVALNDGDRQMRGLTDLFLHLPSIPPTEGDSDAKQPDCPKCPRPSALPPRHRQQSVDGDEQRP